MKVLDILKTIGYGLGVMIVFAWLMFIVVGGPMWLMDDQSVPLYTRILILAAAISTLAFMIGKVYRNT